MEESCAIIETHDLVKKFGSFTAVDKLNLKVNEGKIHGFVGPNGAGKTTTIKMLIGAIRPTDGSGYIKGHRIGSLEAKKIIGYAPEFPIFYSDMSAFDYLVYMGWLGGIRYREACKRASELMYLLGLEKFRDRSVSKFSAGMKKKMGLAQAIINKPEVLILDEPTANLDPTGRIGIVDTLKQLVSESKITVFISSHILTELELLVNYVTLINKGEIVLQGDINEIKKEFNKGRFVLKTSDNRRVIEALKACGFALNISEGGKGDLYLVTDDIKRLKETVVSVLYHEAIYLDSFSEEEVTLENIYKSLIAHGGAN